MDVFKNIIEWFLELTPNQLAVVNLYFSVFGMFLTIIIGVFGVSYAAAQFRLKSSTKISASYSSGWSAYYKDHYISNVVLENHRDKAEAIFGIYLRLGRNTYISLEEFEHNPLILPPFEIVQRNFKPISGYGCNGWEIDLNEAIRKGVKWPGKIVLATSKGKYITKKWKQGWHPIGDSLRNNHLVALETYSAEYQTPSGEMRAVPSNAIYIVHYRENGELRHSTIHDGESAWLNEKRFKITPNYIKDKDSLLFHLQNLSCLSDEGIDSSSFEVIEVSEIPEVKRYKEHYKKSISFLPSNSLFKYFVFWGLAKVHGRKRKRDNHDRNTKGMSYFEKSVVAAYGVFATVFAVITVWNYFWY